MNATKRIGCSAKPAYSIGEAATAIGIGRSKAYQEISAGRLKIRKIGRRTIIAHDDLVDFLNCLPGGKEREVRHEDD